MRSKSPLREIVRLGIADPEVDVSSIHDPIARAVFAEMRPPARLWLRIAQRIRQEAAQGREVTPELVRECVRDIAEGSVDTPIVRPRIDDRRSPYWHDPVVYYLSRDDLIKIGTTTCLYKRSRAVRAERLLGAELGSYDLETHRHNQFADLRVHGEWFRSVEPLLGHIRALPAPPACVKGAVA